MQAYKMPKTVEIEKATCPTCDAPVRENTQYCYNCGSKTEIAALPETNGAATVDDNSKAALDDLADKLSHGSETEVELANAATERKKARVMHRKRNEFAWEPSDDSSILAILFSAFIAFVALIVVILLVIWR